MSAPPLVVRRTIAAPRERVFALASDFARADAVVAAITKVEMLTDGPVGAGSRFRETRVVFGRPATEEMTVAAFDPPASYTVVAESHGARYETAFTFAERDGATEVEMRFAATPLTLFAKVMSFLMRPMIRKMGEMCAQDLADLATAAERSD